MLPSDAFDPVPGFLDTATLGLPPRSARAALEEAIAEWAAGRADARVYNHCVDRARHAFARLAGVDPNSVAIGPQVSPFVATVAAGLEPGAQVLAYRGDFTSLLFPFLSRGDLDVRLTGLDELAAAISARTSLVAVSAVQSADGAVADLGAIADAAAAHDTLALVDATQACGWLPLGGARFDVVVCGAYKWLLSPRGTAFMAVRPQALDRLVPVAAGWYAGEDPWESIYGPPLRLAAGARRFDISPAWLPWVGTAPALELLAHTGVEAIQAHDVGLANRLRAGLQLEPADSAIVSIPASGAAEALQRAGIRAATRADGVRLAFHLYNTPQDADRAAEALSRAAGSRGRPRRPRSPSAPSAAAPRSPS